MNSKLFPNKTVFLKFILYTFKIFNHDFQYSKWNWSTCCISHFHIVLSWKYIILSKLLIKFNMTENSLERGHCTILGCQLQAQKIPGYSALHRTEETTMPYTDWETVSKILVKGGRGGNMTQRSHFALVHCTKYNTQVISYFSPLSK